MDLEPNPAFFTAPADTARAMHAAEMRGQDMQDAPEQHDKLATMISDLSHTGELSMLYRMEIADAITELRAECQRRIDAAVAVERDVCAIIAEHQYAIFSSTEYATGQPTSSIGERFACNNIADAIRARGQK